MVDLGLASSVFSSRVIVVMHHVVTLSLHVTFTTRHVMAFTLGACDGNPCMNGGQCVDMGTENNPKQFTCACAEGYTGLTCQKRIDPCGDEPCQNGGICEPRGEHFHCSCSERFKGKLCEQYIRKRNPCLGDPCGAHGFCEVVNYDFVCECSPGFHGSRCEFQEEPEEIVEEREPVMYPVVEQTAAESALVIGEVVLILFVIFVVIVILVLIHCLRVANKRSKHQCAQEVARMTGKEVEPTPGWFETSNDLCYNFFCYCCKLVARYENDNCNKKVVVGDFRLGDMSKQNSAEIGVNPVSTQLPGTPLRKASVAQSKVASRAPSRTLSRAPSRVGSVETVERAPSAPTPSDQVQCDIKELRTNNAIEDCFFGDRSQNRSTRTARGSLPGFRPFQGSDLPRPEERSGTSPQKYRRMRRYRRRSSPQNSGSGGKYVDILDPNFDDNDDDEDDDFDDDNGYEEDDVVGPAGNVIQPAFRGGVRSNNVDRMYFDDQCVNQSNCFGGDDESLGYERRRNVNAHCRFTEGAGGGDAAVSVVNDDHTKHPRSLNSAGHQRHRDYYDPDDSESDSVPSDDDADEEDGSDDGSGREDNAERRFPGHVPSNGGSRPPSRPVRRDRGTRDGSTRRVSHHNNNPQYHQQDDQGALPDDDDGYSSTGGRMSESDAGGRSRDPQSLHARRLPRHQHRQLSRVRTPHNQPVIRYSPRPNTPTAPATVPPQLVVPPVGSPLVLAAENAAPFYNQRQQQMQQQRQSPPVYYSDNYNLPNYHNPEHDHIMSQKSSNYSRGQYYQVQSGQQQAHLPPPRHLKHPEPHNTPRRARHQLAGWDSKLPAAPSYPRSYPASSQPASIPPLPPDLQERPSRKPKVKGILKKTSAYDSRRIRSSPDANYHPGQYDFPQTSAPAYPPPAYNAYYT